MPTVSERWWCLNCRRVVVLDLHLRCPHCASEHVTTALPPMLTIEQGQLPVHGHNCPECGQQVGCPGTERCNADPREPLLCDECVARGARQV